jgi:hypothetical protein
MAARARDPTRRDDDSCHLSSMVRESVVQPRLNIVSLSRCEKYVRQYSFTLVPKTDKHNQVK